MLRFQRNQLQTVDHDLIVDLVPVVEEVGVVVVRVVAVVVVMVAAEVTGATVVTAAGMVDAAKSGTEVTNREQEPRSRSWLFCFVRLLQREIHPLRVVRGGGSDVRGDPEAFRQARCSAQF